MSGCVIVVQFTWNTNTPL